eukprot:6057379-Prymnesium_polylepis.1
MVFGSDVPEKSSCGPVHDHGEKHRDVGPQGVWTGMGGQQQPRRHENCAEGCQCYDICAPPAIILGISPSLCHDLRSGESSCRCQNQERPDNEAGED